METLLFLSEALSNWRKLKKLWENIYTSKTDAVTKNLKVEEVVSEFLGTGYIPLHISCKSHTCKKLEDSCKNDLVKVEEQFKMTDLISKRQPQSRSFVRTIICKIYVNWTFKIGCERKKVESQHHCLRNFI